MKTETQKMATKIAKTMSLLSAFCERDRYDALVLAAKILESRGYTSPAAIVEAAANSAYRGEEKGRA